MFDRTADEKLYHACLNFCQEFTRYMCTQDLIHRDRYIYTNYERKKLLEPDKNAVRMRYKDLLNAIKEIEEPIK